MYQSIEGYRMARLGWGTSGSPQPFILSEWIMSSVTGRFYYSFRNPGGLRSLVHGVDLVAGTWKFVAFMVPGCPDSTWPKGNTAGMDVTLGLCYGSGAAAAPSEDVWHTTNYYAKADRANLFATMSAEFYRTGLKLSPCVSGTDLPTATHAQLMQRPYDRELAACRRYFHRPGLNGTSYNHYGTGWYQSATTGVFVVYFPVSMRALPTFACSSPSHFAAAISGGGTVLSTLSLSTASVDGCVLGFTIPSGGVAGYVASLGNQIPSATLSFDARL
jgi:hypothetical protein